MSSAPVLSLPARLGWHLRFTEVIFADPPFLVMQAVPEFPGRSDALFERGIVWNIGALLASAKRPGSYPLLTADNGDAPCAGLNQFVQVSHPDVSTVVWELDIAGLRPALDDDAFACDEGGFLRLIFARDAYEADLRTFVRELQRLCNCTIPVTAIPRDVYGLDTLLAEYPTLQTIAVDEIEPDSRGTALEELRALNADGSWLREPLIPPGTVVEFGFFPTDYGHELMRINGRLPRPPVWPSCYFTRWQVLHAFRNWLNYVCRKHAIDSAQISPPDTPQGALVLLDADSLRACHDAGQKLAQVMRETLAEGASAPDVRVRYVEMALPIVRQPTGEAQPLGRDSRRGLRA
jgi:hypothetical protein